MVRDALTQKFADHLQVIPSIAGLHVAAFARTASAEAISAVAGKASEAGVEIQELSTFTRAKPGRAGIVLGYGAIPASKIKEGLRRLRHCFDA